MKTHLNNFGIDIDDLLKSENLARYLSTLTSMAQKLKLEDVSDTR